VKRNRKKIWGYVACFENGGKSPRGPRKVGKKFLIKDFLSKRDGMCYGRRLYIEAKSAAVEIGRGGYCNMEGKILGVGGVGRSEKVTCVMQATSGKY
jgi:hypothetical protein